MGKSCQSCGKKLSLFASGTMCKECRVEQEAEAAIRKAALYTELSNMQSEILQSKGVAEHHLHLLKKHDRQSLMDFYSRIYEAFEADKELEECEIDTLRAIQQASALSNEDIDFDGRVRPYIYINSLRQEGKLPTVNLQVDGGSPPVFKKGEVVHFADTAVLKEIRSINLGYQGGSHGVSIPLGGGVRYRVGAHKGHIQREDKLVETSKGVLVITSHRLFLHPFPGRKPMSIPLTKIISYQCFGNGIEVYKEGREKGYFLSTTQSGSVEMFGLCLGHLLAQA